LDLGFISAYRDTKNFFCKESNGHYENLVAFSITANEHSPWELYQKVFFSLSEKSRHQVKRRWYRIVWIRMVHA